MAQAMIDETGHQYGKLTVIKAIRRPGDRKSVWECQCACSNTIFCAGSDLRLGRRTSCGKHCNNVISEEPGTMYGFLEVIKKDETPAKNFSDHTIHWICKCHLCGTIKSVSGRSLRNGDAQSCGCAKSLGEQYLKKVLNSLNREFNYQQRFDNLISDFSKLKLSYDFAVLENNEIKYLIEFQGNQHYQQIKYFGDKLEKIQACDNKKIEYCKTNNIPLLIINHNDKRISEEALKNIILDFERNINNVKISYYNL